MLRSWYLITHWRLIMTLRMPITNIESVLAPPAPKPQVQPTQPGKETATARKKVVRAYNRQVVFQAKTLQTDADIDDYVEKIRSQLKQLLKNCDEIKLN